MKQAERDEAERGNALEVILTESPAHLRKRLDPESGLALIDPRARDGRRVA